MINEACIDNLTSLRSVISHLNDESYSASLDILSGSSVGQHVRHVLEFYICAIEGASQGVINYDKRRRDLALQTLVSRACETIEAIISEVENLRTDVPLLLEGDYGIDNPSAFSVKTSLQRELAYNLEHSVHHEAIIKIGLKQLDFSLDNEQFGVAASTIRNNK